MAEDSIDLQMTWDRDYHVVVMPSSPGMIREKDFPIATQDGTVLSANLYRPEGEAACPCIVAMTIYRKEDHLKHYEVFLQIPNTHLGTMRFSEEATFEGPDPAFWVPHGYAVLHVDGRGFGKSEGSPQPQSPLAFQDLCDVIEWCARQSWSNGSVGLSGVSYLGICQYFTAAMRPAALKAINPWDARTDLFRSTFLGGIPNTRMASFILENFTVPSLRDPDDAALLRGAADTLNLPRSVDDPYYATRNAMQAAIAEIDIPVLICGSVSDQAKHSRDAFENFVSIRSENKWFYVHRGSEWASYYAERGLALQKRFFDHFLHKKDYGWQDESRVTIDTHFNRTRYTTLRFDNWPPRETDYQKFYLQGTSLKQQPGEQESTTSYDSSDGYAAFDIKFEDSVSVVGHIRLLLWVSTTSGSDMDLFVGLKKFDADGREIFFLGESGNNPNDIVSRGWLRVSQRTLSEGTTSWRTLLSHDRSLPVVPGEPTLCEVEIHPTAVHFQAGDTLRLIIQGESIQPSDVALGFDEKVNAGSHSIHWGGNFPSHIQLPIVPVA
jgi:predicted acyl esterase